MNRRTIALVVPPLTPEERYGRYHRVMGRGVVRPHMGLLSIGAALKEAGHNVILIDAVAHQLDSDETIARICECAPDYVGLAAFSMSVERAAQLADRIKSRDEHIVTILGGPHVTAVPEETMRRFTSFDIGVIGEGERTIVELVAASDAREYRGINGLIISDGDELYRTPPRPFIENLDDLPFPAWELIKGFPEKYPLKRIRYRQHPVGDLCTSRGCPYQCTFCDRASFGSRIRMFSAEYVIEAIDRLRRLYGVREIMFKDDLIMYDRQRLVDICEGLLRKNWGMTWTCMGRADGVDDELTKLMKEAGCWQISYGIESANQKLLDAAQKSLSLENIKGALDMTKRAGISARGFFILGLPFETEETIRETIDFAKRNQLDDINVALMTPFPGTQLYNEAENYGTFDKDWNSMNKFQAVFVPSGLSKEVMEKSQRRFYREFYGRPGFLIKNARVILESLIS